jgi:hypothetical protein
MAQLRPSPSAGRLPQSAADQPAEKPTVRELLASVNAASESAQKFWLAFLTLAIYLLVTIAGTTHLDLLLDTPTTLPLISIRVPLVGFYVVSPALLVAAHFSLLLQHELLHQKISALQSSIKEKTGRSRVNSAAVCSELHGYFFLQAFSEVNLRFTIRLALQVLIVMSLIAFPIMLLFYFQVIFLPYHSVEVTWWHRACLVCDVFLLLFFARSLWLAKAAISRRLPTGRFANSVISSVIRNAIFWTSTRLKSPTFVRVLRGFRRVGILRASLYTLCVFSIGIATVPDELLDRMGSSIWPVRVPLYEPQGDLLARYRKRIVFYPTAVFFERYRDPSIAGASGLFGWSRNLMIVNADLNDRRFRNRDLRYAVFLSSKLQGADFQFAELTGARFGGSTAAMANFSRATLRAAEFIGSEAQAANFSSAQLQRLISIQSQFDGAVFTRANLTIAEIDNSSFDGATFENATLEGAFIYQTNMRGAVFDLACLQGMVFQRDRSTEDGSSDETIGSIAGINDFRASSFRSAVIWQSYLPRKISVNYADFRHTELKQIGSKQRKSLSELFTSLEFVLIPQVARERIQMLLSPSSAQWRGSDSFSSWQTALKRQGPQELDRLGERRGQFLATLVCSDVGKDAWMANAIATRIANDSSEAQAAMALSQALTTEGCYAAKKISEPVLFKLRRLAQSPKDAEVESLTTRIPRRHPGVGETIRVAGCAIDERSVLVK